MKKARVNNNIFPFIKFDLDVVWYLEDHENF